jgi:SWI/SNF-related matrix-associated actin-dependent regulator 1 of chromatin subfamily A
MTLICTEAHLRAPQMIPRPTQLTGAAFLADGARRFLADEPRCGKTGAAIMALDYAQAGRTLVVTTASGRAVWKRAIPDWTAFGRVPQIATESIDPKADVVIVSWGGITQPKLRSALLHCKFDAVIPDEAHYAKNFGAKRTQALYGALLDGGRHLDNHHALAAGQSHIWPLSGTPYPNSPFDIYPHLRALRPDCLRAHDGMPDVTREMDFMHRYCVVKMKKLSAWNRIPVVIGGRNAEELKHRVGDFMLQRTQADVGITEPVYEIMHLPGAVSVKRDLDQIVSDTLRSRLRSGQDIADMEMELAEIRRVTGAAKAKAVVEAVKDEFDCGLDKIVIAYWHTEVGMLLRDGLSTYGVVGIDGSTPPDKRGQAEQRFLSDPKTRVFLGQIKAAGEAINLSSAAELIFAEASLVPADMKQMSMRITNYSQARLPRVRVAALEGSIDEALQDILLRKWSAINGVLPT